MELVFRLGAMVFPVGERHAEVAIEHVEGTTDIENEDIGEITHFIQKIVKTYPCDVQFQWVRGHSDHPMNDMADYIAYHHAQG